MKVYMVRIDDADPYCGYYVVACFSSEEKANEFIAATDRPSELECDEVEVDVINRDDLRRFGVKLTKE